MKITNIQTKTNIVFRNNNNQSNISLPTAERNFTLFNQSRIEEIVNMREKALPKLKQTLQSSNDEKEIVETLYIIDRMIDKKVKGIPAMYPILARFNDTKSANIQVFLAGIYRKTQVPDAFGPLVSMLIKNSIKDAKMQGCKDVKPDKINATAKASENTATFDPNEEIGGAILEYIRNYSQGPKAIDYSA